MRASIFTTIIFVQSSTQLAIVDGSAIQSTSVERNDKLPLRWPSIDGEVVPTSIATRPSLFLGEASDSAITAATYEGGFAASRTLESIDPSATSIISQAEETPFGRFAGLFDTDDPELNLTTNARVQWESSFDKCMAFLRRYNLADGFRQDLSIHSYESQAQNSSCQSADFQWDLANDDPFNSTSSTDATYQLVVFELDTAVLPWNITPNSFISHIFHIPSSTLSSTINSTMHSDEAGPTGAAASSEPEAQNGLSTNDKIGLGVGLGVGVPVVVAAIAAVVFGLRRSSGTNRGFPPNTYPYNAALPDEAVSCGPEKALDSLPQVQATDHGDFLDVTSEILLDGRGIESGSDQGIGGQKRLSRLHIAAPAPLAGANASPVSPLSRRSSVSSVSTLGPDTGTLTMTSEHR